MTKRRLCFLILLFLAIPVVPLAVAEQENSNKPVIGAQAASNNAWAAATAFPNSIGYLFRASSGGLRQEKGRTTVRVGISVNDVEVTSPSQGSGTILLAPVRQLAFPEEGQSVLSTANPSDSICSLESLARHGQIAPNTNGGTLNPVAFINPTTINSSGRIAFNSAVDNSSRNQGVFVADSNGVLTAIAIGCGAPGGFGDTTSVCGDPSPIGGNFSGFFSGTIFTPDSNDAGDVLFFADVNGGGSRRGLFLYRGADQQIIKVAVIGDASPIGGTFGAVGPGSVNSNGAAVFLASPVGQNISNIFMWDNGVVTKVAAIGDPAPDGGTFALLGTESGGFPDGTSVPFGPVPDINDSEQISFRAIVTGGPTERGIIVRTGGVNQWYVRVPDPTPIGGTYEDVQAASINNAGQIAFFADYHPSPETSSSGWFAGAPGNWRKVIVLFDPIDGGQCLGLAFSRNPMQPIDEEGNVAFWTDISGDGSERDVLGLANGDLLIAARKGDPSPIGGTIGTMDPWPSVKGDNGTLNAATPGATDGAISAHMVYRRCAATKVSGRGSIDGQGDQATFNFHANQSGPRPMGSLSFSDSSAGISIARARIRSLNINGDNADFSGTARLGDGSRVTYSVSVTDNSSDGSPDTFSISLSNGYSAGGTLSSGDIQIQ